MRARPAVSTPHYCYPSLQPPHNPHKKPDAATAAWWAQTVALSNDSMEGRDTGSEAYERAAKYVADQFQAAGLKPAGDNGTFFQRVPMHETGLMEIPSSIEILNPAGKITTLRFPTDVTTTPRQKPDLNISVGGKALLLIDARASLKSSSATRHARRRS